MHVAQRGLSDPTERRSLPKGETDAGKGGLGEAYGARGGRAAVTEKNN